MEIAYERVGGGPPLVLVHSLGADRRLWDPVVARLRERRELVVLDLPGFGASPPLTGTEPTPRALAGAVAVALAQMGLQRPHLAGVSLGGWVALELGRSGAAGAVTAIAPAGLWPDPLGPKADRARRLARALLPLVGPVTSTGIGRAALLSSVVAHPRRVPADDAAHLVRSYALSPGLPAVNDAMRAGRFAALERIRCPVTLVWPTRDRLVRRPAWVPDRVREVDLDDAGHLPMWDAPDRLAEMLAPAGATGTTAKAASRVPAPASAPAAARGAAAR